MLTLECDRKGADENAEPEGRELRLASDVAFTGLTDEVGVIVAAEHRTTPKELGELLTDAYFSLVSRICG